MPQRQKLPVEEKVRIILKCLSEEISIGEGAKEVGVAPATLRRWIGTYETEGEEGFLHKRNAAYSAQTKTA
ncbi:MAG: helix-turn-helix domain-containing protein, partial [Pyramidobacter sp.]